MMIDESTMLGKAEALAAITDYRDALWAGRTTLGNRFIVTVKLKKNPEHNPHNKVAGPCPLDQSAQKTCTDVTGEHHSELVYGKSAADINAMYVAHGFHVTRIEEV
jgi:hypothetical protein